MIIALTLFHIIICLFLILMVLLQTGKSADLAGAFGGGGSQTALGSRGATTLLSKLTTFSAVAFMLTSLSLAILHSRKAPSVMDQVDAVGMPTMPAPDFGETAIPADTPPMDPAAATTDTLPPATAAEESEAAAATAAEATEARTEAATEPESSPE